MKGKILLLINAFVLFSSILSIGQVYIGKWQHLNNEKQSVIIEFGNNANYLISIPNKHLGAIERKEGNNLYTNLKYKIDLSTSPATIDIISELSGITLYGIIDFIDNETIQIQVNQIPNGNRPTRFDPDSPEYAKCKRLPANSASDAI